MKKLGIGVMGCASIAQRLMIPAILRLPEYFELKAVASRSKEKAKSFADLFGINAITGYDELLEREDIDVIYMPLPTGLHEEWVIRSLMSGKHVLVEKSLAVNYESACRMSALAIEKGLVLMESFMFCYHAQHQWAKDQLSGDQIGDIRLFRSQFGFPPLDKNNFRYNKNLGGGALLDAGAYTVKVAQLFLGSDLKLLNAVLYTDAENSVDIYGNCTLISPKGTVAQLSFGFDNFYQCNYEFWGSAGRLKAEKAFTPKPGEKPVMLLEKQGVSEKVIMQDDDHFAGILREFYSSVITKKNQLHIDSLLTQSKLLSDIQDQSIKIII